MRLSLTPAAKNGVLSFYLVMFVLPAALIGLAVVLSRRTPPGNR